MGNKGFVNQAKSGQKALPAKLKRIKHHPVPAPRRYADSQRTHQSVQDESRNRFVQDTDSPLQVHVEAYAGSRAEQTPRRFTTLGRTVEVIAVTRQWRTPDHVFFKVSGDDGLTYVLRCDVTGARWELTEQVPAR